ncbi:MAG: transposase [Gammaproteobacteria bacterium]|nr:transposase [Gammaproteobacteria bacterium]
MARIARVVAPDYPHHVTQRGNRRQKTFFCEADYRYYLELLVEAKGRAGVEVWAYCLMPNHVHFVIVPRHTDSLCRFFKEAHRCYTRRINFREGWRGHLWQERFHSFVMDEQYLRATLRYVELNPVRANLCARPEQWPWSSVHAHLKGVDDDIVTVKPMLALIPQWMEYLRVDVDEKELEAIRRYTRTGRPVEEEEFLSGLETVTGRNLRKSKPGPKFDRTM